MSSRQKFLTLGCLLFSAIVVYQVSSCSTCLLIAVVLALIWSVASTFDQR